MVIELEYNVEEEMEKNSKNAEKILKKFSDVEGLRFVLDETLKLMDSDIFNLLIKDFEGIIDEFDNNIDYEGIIKDFDVNNLDDEVLKEFPLLVYADTLKQHKGKRVLYVPKLFGDTIIYSHFSQLMAFIIANLYIKNKKDIHLNDLLLTIERVIILMENFNNKSDFVSLNMDYFIKLKSIKWGKNAEKLLEKIFSIFQNTIDTILKTPFSDNTAMNYSNGRFTLTFLAACNAVNNSREKMEIGDVVVAYKTYYKILDADINDLI